ncbi:hypothetical protein CLV63_12811 [Murinocardiopsis flavida]|uniref:Lipoprotein n=1 Tax=Murinocardiopsis flavida TaxID=645275 RepID=A0A2P8CVC2_9ACTN|nr:hypothetical protein [Murinocardiopsis flavida]PSK88923.1 hypothetical protein CLV63_12811 [Murinocardiopsis flavida]
MRKTKNLTPTLAATGALVLLALTGCSSLGQGDVYDFTRFEGELPSEKITIGFSEELLELAKADGVNPLITSVTVTGRELEGSMCAADVEFTYADGGLDRLADASDDKNSNNEGKSPQEIVAGRTVQGPGDGLTEDKFDESKPEEGTYISEDFTTAVLVAPCAESPTDEDRNLKLKFPDEETYPGYPVHFAEASITFLNDGTIGLIQDESEVKEYQPDSNDQWISD